MVYVGFDTVENWQGQINTPITDVATSITLNSGDGANFADGAQNTIATLTQFDGSGYLEDNVVKREIILITDRTGDTLTVTRGYLGTTATDFLADDYIFVNVMAKHIQELQEEVERLETQKLSIEDYQDGLTIYAASSAGTDTYVISLTPSIDSYVTGQVFNFKADVANTGTATLNVDGLGAKTIKNMLGNDLTTGDIPAGRVVTVQYDGTYMQMISQSALSVTLAEAQTLTNKRITKRVGTVASSATPTINTDNYDMYIITAQAADITSFTTNLSGTPTEGQTLRISITGTAARAITWGGSFESSSVALPTTTVTTERLDVWFVWNSTTTKWRCVASV